LYFISVDKNDLAILKLKPIHLMSKNVKTMKAAYMTSAMLKISSNHAI